jgi:hypothetical protein
MFDNTSYKTYKGKVDEICQKMRFIKKNLDSGNKWQLGSHSGMAEMNFCFAIQHKLINLHKVGQTDHP